MQGGQRRRLSCPRHGRWCKQQESEWRHANSETRLQIMLFFSRSATRFCRSNSNEDGNIPVMNSSPIPSRSPTPEFWRSFKRWSEGGYLAVCVSASFLHPSTFHLLTGFAFWFKQIEASDLYVDRWMGPPELQVLDWLFVLFFVSSFCFFFFYYFIFYYLFFLLLLAFFCFFFLFLCIIVCWKHIYCSNGDF